MNEALNELTSDPSYLENAFITDEDLRSLGSLGG